MSERGGRGLSEGQGPLRVAEQAFRLTSEGPRYRLNIAYRAQLPTDLERHGGFASARGHR